MTAGLDSPTIGKITAALLDAQAEFKPAVKNATNPHFQSKFVDLAGVIEAVGEALRKHRIAVVQPTDRDEDGTTVLLTRLIHESGEFLGGRYPVKGVKPDPQAEGSALTYARRYALMAMVGIAPEDDDGHAASAPPPRRAAKPAAAPFDASQYERLITAAGTTGELVAVGNSIRADKDIPEAGAKALRGQYADRLAELQGTAT